MANFFLIVSYIFSLTLSGTKKKKSSFWGPELLVV